MNHRPECRHELRKLLTPYSVTNLPRAGPWTTEYFGYLPVPKINEDQAEDRSGGRQGYAILDVVRPYATEL